METVVAKVVMWPVAMQMVPVAMETVVAKVVVPVAMEMGTQTLFASRPMAAFVFSAAGGVRSTAAPVPLVYHHDFGGGPLTFLAWKEKDRL
jgi:hypothetical protein